MRANCVVCGGEFEKKGATKACGKACGMKRKAERERQWRKDNQEHCLEWTRQWRTDNRVQHLERTRQWHQDNRETILKRMRTRLAMLALEKHGLSPVVFLSHMIDQRISSTQDAIASNNKEHQ